MALKDWKKISNTKYVNKKRKGTLYIGKNIFKAGYDVTIEIDTVKLEGRVNFPQTHIYEEFDTNSDANRYAIKYMRSH